MKTIVTGVILASEARKEADRILWLLTDSGSIVRVYAGKARGEKSPVRAATEAFTAGKFELFSTGTGYLLDDVDPDRPFADLRTNLNKYALAAYIAKLILRLLSQKQSSAVFTAFANFLYLLSSGEREAQLLKAVMEFFIVSQAGWTPEAERCGECGAESPALFSISQGCALCAGCAASQKVGDAFPIDPVVRRAILRACCGDGRKIFSFTLGGDGLKAFCEIAEAFLLYHTDLRLPELTYYHSLSDFEEELHGIRSEQTGPNS